MSKIIDIIKKKRDNKRLIKKEINTVINDYLNKNIEDYQLSAFLMACFINGLNKKETMYLTDSMLNSGDKFDFSEIKGIKIDKHSTGGVGDKVSFILSPLLASLGYINPMMAGRGLGHTGGTIDKLESVKGYNALMSENKIKNILKEVGAVIFSQSKKIAPADRKFYALRDVTGTVESIPLITSSIVSKKSAEDLSGIIYDVKCGEGAFMKTIKEAKKLSKWLIDISKKMGMKASAMITNMDKVLGKSVGNALELQEALLFLKNKYKAHDLKKITYNLAYSIVSKYETIEKDEFFKKCDQLLLNGIVYEKFIKMIQLSGGKIQSIKNIEKGRFERKIFEFKSKQNGIIQEIDSYKIGKAVSLLGGGRQKLGQKINHNVGLKIIKDINQKVQMGDTIFKIYYEEEDKKKEAIELINKSVIIGNQKNEIQNIYEVY